MCEEVGEEVGHKTLPVLREVEAVDGGAAACEDAREVALGEEERAVPVREPALSEAVVVVEGRGGAP